jgi:hypothetical protein
MMGQQNKIQCEADIKLMTNDNNVDDDDEDEEEEDPSERQ